MTVSHDRWLDAARDVTTDEVAFFRQHGWAKLEGFVSPELTLRLREEIQGLMGRGAERYRGADTPSRGAGDPFATMWRTYDEPSRDNDFLRHFATSAAVGRAGSRFLRDRPVRFYRDEVLVKMPAGSPTPWHQDFPYSSRDRSEQVNLWIALNDLTPEHSTLRFLSGSHRQGVLGRALGTPDNDLVNQYPELLDECPLSPPLHLRAGDATVHHSLVVHNAPANTTDTPRWAYTVVLFQAASLYTGTPQRLTDQLGLVRNEPLDHPLTPVTWVP
ncbi:phytanoyl-CoA dioxygenase family protein [Lentzea kentuckyensis]|uniref:phytanoyl-CoA dioxygenase family protein n=1 Tax=Lentzea kentuckyensis TaxID=360086 RepID=UPI0013025EF5|nr:phytanoyl-CoA dioxygenase family protein [Lentzea kentuckyensis]